MEFTMVWWEITHMREAEGGKSWDYALLAKYNRQWDQHGHRRPNHQLPALGKHCLGHYNLLWVDCFIVKEAAQGFSVFLLPSRTLHWILYYSVLPRATLSLWDMFQEWDASHLGKRYSCRNTAGISLLISFHGDLWRLTVFVSTWAAEWSRLSAIFVSVPMTVSFPVT